MKICIYGAGAVGGLIAGRLAQAGHDLSVVARGAHLTAILKNGLRIEAEGKQTAIRLRANNDPDKLGPQDYVIVAVKGQSLPEVAAGIAPLLGENTSIVTAMNGVPWWFLQAGAPGTSAQRLASIDPDGHIEAAIPLAELVTEPPDAKHVWAASLVRTIPRVGDETWSGDATSDENRQILDFLTRPPSAP